MKTLLNVGLILCCSSFFLFSCPCIAKSETLSKGAPICTTKEYFKEYVNNKNNTPALYQMLIDGKCRCNVTESMIAEVVDWDGAFFTQVKVLWGDEWFIGWTDTILVK